VVKLPSAGQEEKQSRLLKLELAIAKLVVERTSKYEVDYELLRGQTIS